MKDIQVMVADESHVKYVDTILQTIADAAKVRGTGIAKRSPEYVATKMREAKAVIALEGERFAGFSYIETWGNKHYVTTSGLIVHPDYRGLGLAKRIKNLTFTLARVRWPHAKIFSLTSGSAVMTTFSRAMPISSSSSAERSSRTTMPSAFLSAFAAARRLPGRSMGPMP